MESEYFFNVGIHPAPAFEYFEATASSSIPTCPPLLPSVEMQSCWEKEKSTNHSLQFDSAMSSLASSPAVSNSNKSKENFIIRELIGKLGNIEDEILLHSQPPMAASYFTAAGTTSANTSCYSTPLNSPAKVNLHLTNHHFPKESLEYPTVKKANTLSELNSNVADFSADPGFAERAARLSCFGDSFNGRSNQLCLNSLEFVSAFKGCGQTTSKGLLSGISGSSLKTMRAQEGCHSRDQHEMGNSFEAESTVSEQVAADPALKSSSEFNSRKRKASSRGKAKDSPTLQETVNNEKSDSGVSKGIEEDESDKICRKGSSEEKRCKNTPKPAEPPKDYIHVRARRGQATDSHSLAERVRREKISERMKLLQDLVPGCNKVTGKASMLDEIINYVQSLQHQVEFLSMKLASVNTRLDLNMDSLITKDIYQGNHQLPQPPFPLDSMASSLFGHQSLLTSNAFNGALAQPSMDPMDTTLCQNQSFQLPEFSHPNGFSNLCEGDLQSIVHMSFSQNQRRDSSSLLRSLNGPTQATHMKIEL